MGLLGGTSPLMHNLSPLLFFVRKERGTRMFFTYVKCVVDVDQATDAHESGRHGR